MSSLTESLVRQRERVMLQQKPVWRWSWSRGVWYGPMLRLRNGYRWRV